MAGVVFTKFVRCQNRKTQIAESPSWQNEEGKLHNAHQPSHGGSFLSERVRRNRQTKIDIVRLIIPTLVFPRDSKFWFYLSQFVQGILRRPKPLQLGYGCQS
jgi:hypothetical protein